MGGIGGGKGRGILSHCQRVAMPLMRRNWLGQVCTGTAVWATLAGISASLVTDVAAQAPAQPLAPFASLMADSVDVRAEPGFDKPVSFAFKRAGLPVAVREQQNGWVRVEDTSGTSGWVAFDLVSRRRTAIVLPPPDGAAEPTRALRAASRSTSDVLAYLEPGVIVGVVACDGRACRITTSGVRGYVDQDHLWGVSAGETIK
jgi:SH3-like domain-containing protein